MTVDPHAPQLGISSPREISILQMGRTNTVALAPEAGETGACRVPQGPLSTFRPLFHVGGTEHLLLPEAKWNQVLTLSHLPTLVP